MAALYKNPIQTRWEVTAIQVRIPVAVEVKYGAAGDNAVAQPSFEYKIVNRWALAVIEDANREAYDWVRQGLEFYCVNEKGSPYVGIQDNAVRFKTSEEATHALDVVSYNEFMTSLGITKVESFPNKSVDEESSKSTPNAPENNLGMLAAAIFFGIGIGS